VRRLEEFSAVELYAMLKMRVDVFVVEQACAYPELDGNDAACLHLRLLRGRRPARLRPLAAPDTGGAPQASAASPSLRIIAASASAKP
jgi:ElaA protein